MDIKDNSVPELTLEPTPEASSLSIEDALSEEQVKTLADIADLNKTLEESLSPAQLKAVEDLADKIDIGNSSQILQYGSTAQKKMTTFSESALSAVKGQDLDDIGNMITGLVVELESFDPDEKKGFMSLFRKPKQQLNKMQAQYNSVEKNVDKIVGQLEGQKVTLIKDITMLDKLYDMNLEYFKELSLYILAGKKHIERIEKEELPAIKKKAEESGLPEDAQQANDLANQLNRFEKKIYDLELTRNISIQMGPQIRLVQNNDAMMLEKLQSSIANTIPLWKNQMVLTLGLSHAQKAIQAQRQVTDVTNELLRKNADILKTSTIEAAKESERGIVDIETLRHTNESLITTLDEVLQIQKDGREKRLQAQEELQLIEGQLKDKLLEVRDASDNN